MQYLELLLDGVIYYGEYDSTKGQLCVDQPELDIYWPSQIFLTLNQAKFEFYQAFKKR